jgi:uncharacterized Rossmann fold enzyme
MILPANLDDKVPVRCNTSDVLIHGNIRFSRSLPLPWLQLSESVLDEPVMIVGGGPSVRAFLPAIKAQQQAGWKVCALNGAMTMLAEIGVKPDYFVMLDARLVNVKFLYGANAEHYLIASQCHPAVFEVLEGENVTLWHPNFPGIKDIIGDTTCALIGGGTTVGLQAMSIMYVIGHRQIHLYGFDSSYSNGMGHAYPQPANDGERTEEYFVGGKSFTAASWMVRQVMEFQSTAAQLAHAGCEIAVHGFGLLPEMARQLTLPDTDTLDAVYDLSLSPASWDFIPWLVRAEMARKRSGFKKLAVSFLPGPKNGFRDDPLPDYDKRQILENVMRPAIALIGAVEGKATAGWRSGYTVNQIVEDSNKGEAVPVFSAPQWARDKIAAQLKNRTPVVIVLREAQHWPKRNSNMADWLKFAAELGDVIFVRDTAKADEPLEGFHTHPEASRDINVRLALYEHASVVMGVNNGPMTILEFMNVPFLQFKKTVPDYPPSAREWIEKFIGIPFGGQHPWHNAKQRIVWADDTYAAIKQAYIDLHRQPLAATG